MSSQPKFSNSGGTCMISDIIMSSHGMYYVHGCVIMHACLNDDGDE